MSINWFPGHMNKAIREIREILPKVDLIIEIVDARIPYSSSNPVIAKFRANKPCLKLLSKSDLADPEMTRQWVAHLEQQDNVKALALAGSAAMQRGDAAAARVHWERLLTLLPADSPLIQPIKESMGEAAAGSAAK